jgi:hypothetical protein
MTVLLLKLVQGPRCHGCGAIHRWVSKRTHLCLYCMGLQLDVDARKGKLMDTLNERFAAKGTLTFNQKAARGAAKILCASVCLGVLGYALVVLLFCFGKG